MPGVDRTINGGKAVLSLVIWPGNAQTVDTSSSGYGVLTFVNLTSDYTIPLPYTPLPPGLDGMYTDLIISPIPETSIADLAGLGAALLLVFRRRRD